jgi:hypothetical protein
MTNPAVAKKLRFGRQLGLDGNKGAGFDFRSSSFSFFCFSSVIYL